MLPQGGTIFLLPLAGEGGPQGPDEGTRPSIARGNTRDLSRPHPNPSPASGRGAQSVDRGLTMRTRSTRP
ncbi:hypothetical protein [Lysobacter gummosus]|uniref:hypothetical protein n=1 Tax=Lysobacter gummosus TaxID=262324 RepID=UPI00363B5D3D